MAKSFAPRRTLAELSHLRSPPAVEVLADASLDVAPGSIVCLMGRNGAGKTTLLRLAAGVLLPDGGRISVFGRDPAADPGTRAEIGLLSSSERSCYWRLTALRNLLFWGSLQGLHGRELNRAVSESSRVVECQDYLQKRYEDLSTGMRQRVGIARAILHSPRLLLLDEPTRSIDAESANSLARLLRRMADGGTAILMATHSLLEARRLGDRIVRIDDGRLKECEKGIEDDASTMEIDFRGTTEQSPPFGWKLADGVLTCPAMELSDAVEWLRGAGLTVTGVRGDGALS